MGWVGRCIVVGTMLLAARGTALAAQEAGEAQAVRVAEGTVTAVSPASRTLVVESRLGNEGWTIGVEVPADVVIKGDGAKKLEDLKQGDRVRVRWVREEHRLLAKDIRLLPGKR